MTGDSALLDNRNVQAFKKSSLDVGELTVILPSEFKEESYQALEYYIYIPHAYANPEAMDLGLAFILMDDDQLAQVAYEFIKKTTQSIEPTLVVAVKKPYKGYDNTSLINLLGHIRGRFNIAETKLWSVGEGSGASACVSLNRVCPSAFASMAVNKKVRKLRGPWLTTKPVLSGRNYNVVDVPLWSVTKLMDRTINWTKKHTNYVKVASSSNQDKAFLAIDKDYLGKTAWEATEPGPSWISLDFREPLYITRWAVHSVKTIENCLLEYSLDGITWKKLDKVEKNQSTRIDRFVKRGLLARYFRLFSISPMHVFEFEIYGDHSTFDSFKYEMYQGDCGSYLAYRLFEPDPENLPEGKKVPLVVYLHGAGQRGHYNEAQLSITCGEGATNIAYPWWQKKHPCYIAAIQCPLEEAHASDRVAKNEADLIRGIIKRFSRIDDNRIYLTGISLGGFGTYKLGIENPELFAALVPVAGGGMANFESYPGMAPFLGLTEKDNAGDIKTGNYYDRASILKNMPVWAFHSADDNIVSVELCTSMVEAIRSAGNKSIRQTIYPKGTFGATPHYSWLYAYYDYDMWEWLFGQAKNKSTNKEIYQ